MSGAGRMVFQPGAVLTASQVQNYLQDQAVQYYAGTAARGSAIGTATTEGMMSYLADSNQLQVATGTATWQNVSMVQSPNFLLNGDFSIWQRGTAAVTTAGNFAADRWIIGSSAGTDSVTRSTDVPAEIDTLYSLSYAGTSTTNPRIIQKIEAANATYLAGKTVTLSFYAKSTTGSAPIRVTTAYPTTTADTFGTWASPSVTNDNASMSVTPTGNASSSWTRYSVTFAVSANAVRGYQILIYRDTTTTSTTTLYAGIQLEVGETATPFRTNQNTFQAELAACQRYYEKSYAVDVAPGTANTGGSECHFVDTRVLTGGTTYRAYGKVTYKVEKRATPTLTFYSQAGTSGKGTKERAGNAGTTGYYNAYVATSADTSGAPAINDSSTTGMIVSTDVGGSLPTTSWVTMHWVANAEL